MARKQKTPRSKPHLEPTAPLPPAEASRYVAIPVAAAADVAAIYGKDTVITIARDHESQRIDVVTWGASAIDKEEARRQGEVLLLALGCDLAKVDVLADFHANYRPAIQKEALDILTRVQASKWCSAAVRQQIGRLLRLATALSPANTPAE